MCLYVTPLYSFVFVSCVLSAALRDTHWLPHIILGRSEWREAFPILWWGVDGQCIHTHWFPGVSQSTIRFCLCLITWKLRLYNEMHLYLVHHQVETFHTGELIFSQPPSKDYQFIKNVLAGHGGICLQYQHSGWDRRFVNLRLTSAMEVRPDLVGDYYTLTVQCSCCAFELHCSF